MSKRRRKKQSVSQRVLWLVSLFLVGSMVISLIIVALPSAPEPAPTLFPTFTPIPRPTSTPSPQPQPTDTVLPTLTQPPAATATEPALGPELATATITATQPITYSIPVGSAPSPTDTPAPTATPAASTKPLTFAVCGDRRDNPAVYARVPAAVAESGSEFLVHTGDLVNSGTEALWQGFTQVMKV